MTCQVTVADEQSEFEFYQQWLHTSLVDCSGPLIHIGFTDASLTEIFTALLRAGMSPDALDSLEASMLDSSHISYLMCSKHWILLSQKVGVTGTKLSNELWIQLSFYIFRVLCLENGWDYKEVMNYTLNLQ